jgi:hypothetical protein
MANPGEMPGFFDRYSIGHAALGMVFEASRIPAPIAIGSHVVFEMIEDDAKKLVKPLFPDTRPESLENHTGDVVAFTAGYYATRALRGSIGNEIMLSAFVALGAGIWMWALMRGPDAVPREASEL